MDIRTLLPEVSEEQLARCLASDAFIAPYNPYQSIFPNRTTFRSSEVDLAKRLVNRGYRVAFPEVGAAMRKEVLLQKGLDLQDPLMLFVVSIPVNLILNLVASFLLHLVLKGTRIIIIQVSRDGQIESFTDQNGQDIDDKEMDVVIQSREKLQNFRRPREDSKLPVPIYLEHTSKLIGWGRLWLDEKGLKVKARIDDDTTLSRIKSGELVGFSLGGIAKEYECEICHKDYVTCPHLIGKTYRGKESVRRIKDLDIAEISIVSDPANMYCSISEAVVEHGESFK